MLIPDLKFKFKIQIWNSKFKFKNLAWCHEECSMPTNTNTTTAATTSIIQIQISIQNTKLAPVQSPLNSISNSLTFSGQYSIFYLTLSGPYLISDSLSLSSLYLILNFSSLFGPYLFFVTLSAPCLIFPNPSWSVFYFWLSNPFSPVFNFFLTLSGRYLIFDCLSFLVHIWFLIPWLVLVHI